MIESVVGVAATLGIAALCGVPNLGLAAIAPHPVWLVVLVIAARYGTRGLAVALPIAWGALALAERRRRPGARAGHAWRCRSSWGRWRATVLVGWIASGNERRERGAGAARSPSWNGAWPPTPRRSPICAAPRWRCARATIASICR